MATRYSSGLISFGHADNHGHLLLELYHVEYSSLVLSGKRDLQFDSPMQGW